MSIQSEFISKCLTPSDINEHLNVLYKYASECKSVVELGTRFGVSTWAFIAARPEKLVCYDIERQKTIDGIEATCKEEGQPFEFKLQSSLECDLPEVDLLFIDSFHTAKQLRAELKRHSGAVNKYIIMHDIVSHGEVGEENLPGLNFAIREFLEENWYEWRVKEYYTNNSGLLVLERCDDIR